MNMIGYIGGGGGGWMGMMIFMVPGLLLGLYAQYRLKSTYGRYINEPTNSGISGAQAARAILDDAGLYDMPVEMTPGELSDHYDPTRKALFLSEANYHGRTIAAVGVAAHEAGHALQHKAAYAFLNLRMMLVPVTNIASGASMFLFMLGAFLGAAKFFLAGIIIYGILALFQIVTLPVEYDASSRAKKELIRLGLVRGEEETRGVSKVLSAAALTYVAGMVTVVLQLLYFVLQFTNMRSSERES
jgi:Zn-dependent membrane protease YugP